jgi:hypothetical protein
MIVSVLLQNVHRLPENRTSFEKKVRVDFVSGAVSDNPIRRRMQRIERSLQSQQPGDQLPDEISSALEGVECLLGLAQPQQEIRESVTRESVLSDIQSASNTTVSPGVGQYVAVPEVIGSPEGSQKSHGRPALFSEATHKRWAAQSAVGQSCTGVPSHALIRLMTRYHLLTLDFKDLRLSVCLVPMNLRNLKISNDSFSLASLPPTMPYSFLTHIVHMSTHFIISYQPYFLLGCD